MKAVLLAGGRGERLRPITDTRPKPLVPVLARPVMDYCLSLLAHHGVKRSYITTHYLADRISERYGPQAFGMELEYCREETPLGTAGGVKNLEERLRDEELFLVLCADALCDFDLTRAIAFHREKKADATVILSSVKTPLEYGVVLQDRFERICAFSEKPDWSETLSDQVNTGVYILSPKVLSFVPKGKPFDFAHDLFPLLLDSGFSLYGYKDEGYWCDIGRIHTLYQCNRDLMDGRVRTYLSRAGRTVKLEDGQGSYFLSDTARVDPEAVVGAGSVLSEGVELKKGSRVDGAILFDGVRLESGAEAKSAILCESVHLEEDALALSGSVVGAESVLKRGALARAGIKYPPNSILSAQDPFSDESVSFTERGAAVGETLGLDRDGAERLGRSFAKTMQGPIGIVWDAAKPNSRHFALSVAAGVIQSAFDARLFGEGSLEIASFTAATCALPVVYVSEENQRGLLFVLDRDGFALPRKLTLKLSGSLDREREGSESGRIQTESPASDRYVDALSRVIGIFDRKSIGIAGNAASYLREAAIKSGLDAYNGIKSEGFSVALFEDCLKWYHNKNRLADTENARFFVAMRQFAMGKRHFSVPDHASPVIVRRLQKLGASVETYSCHHSNRVRSAKSAELHDRFWYDKNFLAATLLHYVLSAEPESILHETKKLPNLYVTTLYYEPEDENKAKLIRYCRHDPDKRVRLESGFYGIKIISEALSVEAALENAFQYRGKINELEKNMEGRE